MVALCFHQQPCWFSDNNGLNNRTVFSRRDRHCTFCAHIRSDRKCSAKWKVAIRNGLQEAQHNSTTKRLLPETPDYACTCIPAQRPATDKIRRVNTSHLTALHFSNLMNYLFYANVQFLTMKTFVLILIKLTYDLYSHHCVLYCILKCVWLLLVYTLNGISDK